MKIFNRKFSKVILLFFCSLMLTAYLTSCGSSGGGTSDNGGDGGNGGGSDDTLLAAETIGLEGGTISADGLSLEIPEGSFSGDTELKVYVSKEENPFGDNALSQVFRIDGIPSDYSIPIKIRIKYDGNFTKDSCIAIGDESLINGTGGVTSTFEMFEAVDSDGYLVAELPVPERNSAAVIQSAAASNDGWTTITLKASAGEVIISDMSSKGHFRLYESEPNTATTEQKTILLESLEEAYALLQTMGFTYEGRDFSQKPVKVNLIKLIRKTGFDESHGSFIPSWWGGYLEIVPYQYTGLGKTYLKQIAGHFFFHLVQDLYDNRWHFQKGDDPEHLWLNEAAATWFEYRITENDDSIIPVNSSRYKDYMEIFAGLQKGAEEKALKHGFNMSSMFRYLLQEDIYGEGKLALIYQQIKKGKKPVEAIIQGIEDPILWLSDVYKAYILGNIKVPAEPDQTIKSNHPLYDYFNDLTNRIPIGPGKKDTLTYTMADISGDFTIVDADPAVEALKFSISGDTDTSLSLFKLRWDIDDGEWIIEYVETGQDEVTIAGLGTLTNRGWQYLAMITNRRAESPYTKKTAVDLTIEPTSFIKFPLVFNGSGTLTITYHWAYGVEIDFSCSSSSTYTLKLESDGSATMSYSQEKRLGLDLNGKLTCDDVMGPGPVPGNGRHNSVDYFWFEDKELGCAEFDPYRIDGNFTKDSISGSGELYQCMNIGEPKIPNQKWIIGQTYKFDFPNLPKYIK